MNVCGWCRQIQVSERAIYCSRKCRQSAFRLRGRGAGVVASSGPGLRFAYADPPYPGLSARFYRREESFAGEVDHRLLVRALIAGDYAGWALSTSSAALRMVLPLCPASARVCAWVKPIGVPPATYGLHSTWEALIVVGGRQQRPGRRDWLRAQPARNGGSLMGRKPLAFCAFLFGALGMVPGDELDDMFPGTGVVGRAWASLGSWATSRGAGRQRQPSSKYSATSRGADRQREASLLEERQPAVSQATSRR